MPFQILPQEPPPVSLGGVDGPASGLTNATRFDSSVTTRLLIICSSGRFAEAPQPTSGLCFHVLGLPVGTETIRWVQYPVPQTPVKDGPPKICTTRAGKWAEK